MREDKVNCIVDDTIKFGFFYSSPTSIYDSLVINKNMKSIDINDSTLDWRILKNEIDLSELSIIFLDGGNRPKMCVMKKKI